MVEKRICCVAVSIFLLILLTASSISGVGLFSNQNPFILKISDIKNANKDEDQVDITTTSANQQSTTMSSSQQSISQIFQTIKTTAR